MALSTLLQPHWLLLCSLDTFRVTGRFFFQLFIWLPKPHGKEKTTTYRELPLLSYAVIVAQ